MELVLYKSHRKLVLNTIMFGILGGGATWLGIQEPNLIVFLFAIVGWIALIDTLSDLSDKGPQVIINEKGIKDLRWKYGLIPWGNVEAVWIVRYRYYEALAIKLRQPDLYVNQMPRIERILRKDDPKIGWGHFAMNFHNLTHDIYYVWDHIALLKSRGYAPISMGRDHR